MVGPNLDGPRAGRNDIDTQCFPVIQKVHAAIQPVNCSVNERQDSSRGNRGGSVCVRDKSGFNSGNEARPGDKPLCVKHPANEGIYFFPRSSSTASPNARPIWSIVLGLPR
jgi:hypothetical protein